MKCKGLLSSLLLQRKVCEASRLVSILCCNHFHLSSAAIGRQRTPADRITVDSLRTELASVKHQNQSLQRQVTVLERRLGAAEPSLGPHIGDHHPAVIELRSQVAELAQQLVEKTRAIGSLQDDIEILREPNRSLVREYGLLEFD